MIRIFLALLTSLIAVWYLADTLKQKGPGYAYLYYNNYSIETSFWLLAAAILFAVVFIYASIKLCVFLLRLSIKVGVLPQKMGLHKSRKFWYSGMLYYLDQHWQRAVNDMSKSIKRAEMPFLSCLVVIQANLQQGDIESAEQHYRLAEDCADNDELSLLLARVDILIAKQQVEEAQVALKNLLRDYPGEVRVTGKAIHFYRQQENYTALQPLLKVAKKQSLLSASVIEDCQLAVYQARLRQAVSEKDLSALKKLWRPINKTNHADLKLGYFNGLRELADDEGLAKPLRHELDKHYDARLMALYGQLVLTNPDEQLRFAEAFIVTRSEDAELLLAVAEIAYNAKLWGKAKDYLLESIELAASVRAYQLLAAVFAEHEQPQESLSYLEKGLAFALTVENARAAA